MKVNIDPLAAALGHESVGSVEVGSNIIDVEIGGRTIHLAERGGMLQVNGGLGTGALVLYPKAGNLVAIEPLPEGDYGEHRGAPHEEPACLLNREGVW